MHIVIDPRRGVLRWSEFTKRRVRMRIDETRNGRYAAGVDDDLGTADRRSDLLDDSILDIYRIGCANRILQVPGEQDANVFNQNGFRGEL
ncbi:MAG: hypothetical protein DMG17_25080 [Acidobacteria bacterium]|nr:MAG: hypothetical protein DMG17_25080 [Acidobacteriota bacterium]